MVDRTLILMLLGYIGGTTWGAYEWLRPLSQPPAALRATSAPTTAFSVPTATVGDLDAFSEITERPLFIAGRQPEPTRSQALNTEQSLGTTISPSSLSDIRLTAVVTDGNQLTALVESGSGRSEKLKVGSQLDNWQVDDIADDRIVLTIGSRSEVLEVYQFDTVPVASPTPRRRPSLRRKPRVLPNPSPTDEASDAAPPQPDDPRPPQKGPAQ